MDLNIRRFAYLLFVLGVLFSIETYLGFMILAKLWPLIITSLGSGFIAIFYKRKKREPLYLATGTFFICFSILALVCNFTNWNLSGLWPLFISFIGISQLALYIFHTRHNLYLFLSVLFLSISVVLFLVFSISYKFWWIIFFLLGLTIILTVNKNEKKHTVHRN